MAKSQKPVLNFVSNLSEISTIAPSDESENSWDDFESSLLTRACGSLYELENRFDSASPTSCRTCANDAIAVIGIQPGICEYDREAAVDYHLLGVPCEYEEGGRENVEVKPFQIACNSFESSASGAWNHPEETAILIDWDDTLCPTSIFGELLKSGRVILERSPALIAHEVAVVALLQDAALLGGVVILTMADVQWVENTITMLMPEVGKTLTNLGIEIIGARTSKPRLLRESRADDRDHGQYLKTKAIRRALNSFYGTRGSILRRTFGGERSWKNVISIGDSDAERLALQDVIFHHKQRDKHGRWKECRCKTVRLVEEPDLETLTKEQHMLRDILPCIVQHDGDVDLGLNIRRTLTKEQHMLRDILPSIVHHDGEVDLGLNTRRR